MVDVTSAAPPVPPIVGNGLTVTTSQPLLDLTQTWNAGAITFTGIKANFTDTASAAASLMVDLRVNNTQLFGVDKAGVGSAQIWAAFGGGMRAQSNSGTVAWGASLDVILARDAANVLGQRNGVNAQTLWAYNTFTDASNFERGGLQWSGNILRLATQSAGTGTGRNLVFQVAGTDILTLNSGGLATFSSAVQVESRTKLTTGGGTTDGVLRWTTNAGGNLTVAGLPAAATAGANARAMVTDGSVVAAGNFGTVVAGGGANVVPVYCDGTNWRIG